MDVNELLDEIARLSEIIKRIKDELGLDEEDWMN